MSESLITSAVTVTMAIVGVAIIAILLSRQSNTVGVLGGGASAVSKVLQTAEAPIIGGSLSLGGLGSGFSGGAL